MESEPVKRYLINFTGKRHTLTPQKCQGSRLLVLNQEGCDYEVNIQQADYLRTHSIRFVSGESQFIMRITITDIHC